MIRGGLIRGKLMFGVRTATATALVLAATASGALADVRPPQPAALDPAAPAAAPDPAVDEAGNANLEPVALRKGLLFTFAFGGGITLGFGMDNATGRGGAATLRLAHVATARSLIAIELVGAALFYKIAAGDMSATYTTENSNFLIGGQYYVNPGLWVRAAVGLGRYKGEDLAIDGAIVRERFRINGPAGSAGAGIDLVRLKRFRLGFEVTSTAMINRDGVLSSSGFLLAASVD